MSYDTSSQNVQHNPSPEETPNFAESNTGAMVSKVIRVALLGLERRAMISVAETPIGRLSSR